MIHGYVPRPDVTDVAIQQCINDYLEMQAKARAWDALRKELFPTEKRVLDRMDALVQSARATAFATTPRA